MPEGSITTRPHASRTDTGADPEYTRLHIAPFDADLAKVVIPASVLPKAQNISYHTVETLPEKRFGFVELPNEDAEKIKKKLNGNVLKGSKMRITKARPETWKEPSPEQSVPDKKRKKNKDDGGKEKKRKKDHNVIPGIELEEGRKVKRGWTVTEEDKIKEKRKSKKDRDSEKKEAKEKGKDKEKKTKKREERSKYTEKEECLLKTKLPGVPEPAVPADSEDPDRKKRKKSKSRETIIHEFANTTKYPTFLKANKPSATGPVTTEFVEGKGWVDAEGNVVEDVKLTRPEAIRRKKVTPVIQPPEDDTTSSSGTSSEDEDPTPKATPKRVTTPPSQPAPVDDDTTSSSGSSSEDDSDSDEEEQVKQPPNTALATPAKSILKSRAPPPAEGDTSSSGSSSEDAENEDTRAAQGVAPSPIDALKNDARPKSSSSNVSLTIKIPPPPMTPGKVHPLEALYKRSKEASTEGQDAQPFSFFAGDDIEEEDESAAASMAQVPMTPFTERDFEWRQLRSAAPTPDTAHPSRVKNFWAIGAEGGDEEMVDDDEEATETIEGETSATGEAGPSGDFQKWFWENRRDLNRSWMKRKKTAAKEKRHRDNKSRAAKAL